MISCLNPGIWSSVLRSGDGIVPRLVIEGKAIRLRSIGRDCSFGRVVDSRRTFPRIPGVFWMIAVSLPLWCCLLPNATWRWISLNRLSGCDGAIPDGNEGWTSSGFHDDVGHRTAGCSGDARL